MKVSAVIEMQCATTFLCKSLTRRCLRHGLVGKCKILFFAENALFSNAA